MASAVTPGWFTAGNFALLLLEPLVPLALVVVGDELVSCALPQLANRIATTAITPPNVRRIRPPLICTRLGPFRSPAGRYNKCEICNVWGTDDPRRGRRWTRVQPLLT